jgi:hypothetical protein
MKHIETLLSSDVNDETYVVVISSYTNSISANTDQIMFLPTNLHCRNVMTKIQVKQERTLNVTKKPRLHNDFHWLRDVREVNMKALVRTVLLHRDMITTLTVLLLMVYDY